jgi:hypothetical protein
VIHINYLSNARRYIKPMLIKRVALPHYYATEMVGQDFETTEMMELEMEEDPMGEDEDNNGAHHSRPLLLFIIYWLLLPSHHRHQHQPLSPTSHSSISLQERACSFGKGAWAISRTMRSWSVLCR